MVRYKHFWRIFYYLIEFYSLHIIYTVYLTISEHWIAIREKKCCRYYIIILVWCEAIMFYYVFIISTTVLFGMLFVNNSRAGKEKKNQCVTLTTYLALASQTPLRLCARMLMARDELFPSYLDTARGTSSIHLPVAAPYNIIRALLNIKNVTLKWLIHLRCKHECVPKVSFLICESCGGVPTAVKVAAAVTVVVAAESETGNGSRRYDIQKKKFARSYLLNYISRCVYHVNIQLRR